MTGRLEGTVFGRPVELDATGRELLLRISDLRSAWRLRRSATTSLLPLVRALRKAELGLRVLIGPRFSVEILPKPSLAVRVLLPALKLTSSAEVG